MTTQEARRLIRTELPRVRDILLQAGRLPEWNSAFVALDAPATATVGERYPLTVRGGMRGYLEYTEIGAYDIGLTWRFPGFRETGAWHLEAHGPATLVTHGFSHSGPVARALRPAFAGVADLRLDRLTQRSPTHPLTHPIAHPPTHPRPDRR
jgi:hypothetical protein